MFGILLFGGLHFTTFVMYISSLDMFASFNAFDNFFPAIPINGSPLLSSFLPGASPMKITSDRKLPLPGTELVLVLHKSQFVHLMTFCFTMSNFFTIFLIHTFYCCICSNCRSPISHNH
ncbi:MAG: hypothetical protein MAG458_01436 [Nitrosopumilus sp.]|nr:hypothetical protein [Nitrosopumilus sp.]